MPAAEALVTTAVRHYQSMTPTKGLLDVLAAKKRDQDRGADAGRERRLANLRRSGIAKHLGRDERGVGDVTRIVRDELEPREALRLMQAFASEARMSPKRWMIIGGGTGVGKSVAAGWLLARSGGRYVTIHELVELHSALAKPLAPATMDEINERLDALVHACVVVLDELGQETNAPLARAALHWFVEARIAVPQSTRWTVVMGNRSAAAIRERFTSGVYDARTESRLRPVLWRNALGAGIWDLADKVDGRGAPL
jgi:hypothetical protein